MLLHVPYSSSIYTYSTLFIHSTDVIRSHLPSGTFWVVCIIISLVIKNMTFRIFDVVHLCKIQYSHFRSNLKRKIDSTRLTFLQVVAKLSRSIFNTTTTYNARTNSKRSLGTTRTRDYWVTS